MFYPRRVLAAAAAAAIGLSLLSASSAGAAESTCTITGYQPTKVIMGADEVPITFTVQSSGCAGLTWNIDIPTITWAMEEEPMVTFYPPFARNKNAGARTGTLSMLDRHGDGPTKNIRFSLLRRATFGSTFDATPEPVKKGKKITLKATLTRVNWKSADIQNYIAFPKAKMAVQFRAEGASSYSTVRTVTSGAGGKVSTAVKATKTGRWRLVSTATSTTASATSASDVVKVR
jgi:hypothetical protein